MWWRSNEEFVGIQWGSQVLVWLQDPERNENIYEGVKHRRWQRAGTFHDITFVKTCTPLLWSPSPRHSGVIAQAKLRTHETYDNVVDQLNQLNRSGEIWMSYVQVACGYRNPTYSFCSRLFDAIPNPDSWKLHHWRFTNQCLCNDIRCLITQAHVFCAYNTTGASSYSAKA